MKCLIFFLIIPGLLFSEIIETFYGDVDVTEPMLLEIIKSPTFQRLKKIHQYGIAYYDGSYTEEYTRYDHSLGVFAILRLKGCSVNEQAAGLLHDISHTVFSHVGDWVFFREYQEKDYQNFIFKQFIQKTELKGILEKHGLMVDQIVPIKEFFPALEQPLPNLCADRIDYNIQGAFHKKYLTKEETRGLIDNLEFNNGRWVCHNPKLMAKVVRFSLYMTVNSWGGAENHVSSRWLADAILKGVEIGLITEDDIHFGTDDAVWQKLCGSKDPFIVLRIRAIFNKHEFFQLVENEKDADDVIKSKFRGIDPYVLWKGKVVRLTSIDHELEKEFQKNKKEVKKGWAIKYLMTSYQGALLKR